jgi:hypothetical protein
LAVVGNRVPSDSKPGSFNAHSRTADAAWLISASR